MCRLPRDIQLYNWAELMYLSVCEQDNEKKKRNTQIRETDREKAIRRLKKGVEERKEEEKKNMRE